ncbi:Acyl-CoA dehydrogenase [Amycolatopsis arida]|uniref:Acyl-CoA dehydrogenase n=1 Tax=Amycolatopsis arida TaxID=587909 RepID=A0A1I5VNS5_9PSEU|nr:acyl-CoA dehydrogenase family protein [Amycolatopsis arida]TDX87968.1 alkylation response protein AidB-like acyl-CoA dehydrogenase [Amycolatopsis arida]SFQ09072.1 Acyl-CoA dehydrogenase [Amycolatopsis arida]
MELLVTDEQRALAEAVRAVLRRTEGSRVWETLCAQVGVAGLAVPEEYGGAGAGPRELAVVAEELGRELVGGPFLGSAVLATAAVLAAGDTAAAARLLPGLAEGRAVAALAWVPEGGRWDPSTVACSASEGGVTGTAHYVPDGDRADVLLVVARDAAGVGLYEVDPAGPAVRRERTATMDETRPLATVTFTGAPARRLGGGDVRPALARVRDLACAVLAAEQAGAAAGALEITVAYTKEREQFGRPIGGFQALKHRMADLYVLTETARSAALAAADALTRGGTGDAEPVPARLAAVAKAHCSEALSTVAAEMIQLHGGIGITWEHPAHRYLKRAHGSAQLLGQPHEHLARLRQCAQPRPR